MPNLSYSNDILEILKLYEGVSPAWKYRPELIPDNLSEGQANPLLLRSQLPVHLEEAFEIALSEYLIELEELTVSEQMRFYQILDISIQEKMTVEVPPMIDDDGIETTIPLNDEALVHLTNKGRAALTVSRQASPALSTGNTATQPSEQRLVIDLKAMTVTLDGKVHDVKSEQALRWVKVLYDNSPEWISASQLEEHDDELLNGRPDKHKKYLPKEILELINSSNKGSRIKLP